MTRYHMTLTTLQPKGSNLYRILVVFYSLDLGILFVYLITDCPKKKVYYLYTKVVPNILKQYLPYN